jgi:filamentous hemagglutinin
MLVAVEETATATGKQAGGTTVCSRKSQGVIFSLRQIAFTALALLGALPSWSGAQIVPGGAHAPSVIQTQNGLDQVNISRPSGAGVSMNTYGQFDVQPKGAILNNSPTIVQTQQAGMINGNPNFGPGQSARVIVNQVNSSAASQINGHLEVAGQRAEVVIANGSGISVNGGGFINTSRAILTTGTPNFAPDGSLAGFNVSGGQITVQGAGLNAGDTDQVDLLSRAVQANAAIYAKNLNVVTGANSVSHDTLNATPIAGDGPAPGVSIDVSNLGGMYANRIVLVGTENGIGVSTRGVLAAQAGDLVLTTQGKLVLAGQTNASGNINVSARDGIDNGGTTYAQQNVSVNTSGALTNSGVLAAQQNTTVSAASVVSTGTLGAGVNGDGTIANAGDLSVAANGAVTATGRNEGGGNTTIQGTSVSLAGSNTSANGALALTANGGDLNLSGATTTAGGALNANATGTLVNDSGNLSGGGAMRVSAANVSNAGGQIVSGSTLGLDTAGALVNRQGVVQSAALAGISAATLDNTAGRIVSLNGDGMTLTTTGALVNGADGTGAGTIGTNGALNVSAGALANQGHINASSSATVRAQVIDNHAGSIVAGNALNATSAGVLNNAGGTLSGSATTVSVSAIDNTNGDINGDSLALSTTGNLVNRGGRLTQYGAGNQTIDAGGTLDNTGGTIASNANRLTVTAQAITNDGGMLQHAGMAALALNSGSAVSNVSGQIATNGALAMSGTALSNRQGAIQAAARAVFTLASLDNTAGRIVSLNGDGMALTTTGALVNGAGGTIGTNGALNVSAGALANQGHINASTNATVQAQVFDNHAGSVSAGGALNASTTGALNNAGGTLSGSATTVSASSIDNTNGDIDGDALAVSTTGNLVNRGGRLTQYGTADQTVSAGGTLDNTGGTIASNASNLSVSARTVTNDSGTLQHAGTGTLALNATGAISNASGKMLTNGALGATGASLDNTGGTLSAQRAAQVNAASGVVNRSGTLYGGTGLSVTTQGDIDNTGGSAQTAGDLSVAAGGALANAQGTIAANGAHGAVKVSAAAIDNTGGKLTNTGDGATTVTANSVTNTNGTLGGNGDVTVNAQTLANDAGGNLVAGGAANLNVTQNVNNAGGTIFGGTALTLNQANAAVINDGGAILGGLDVSVNVASLSNAGGAIRANRDLSAAAVVSGNGDMIAGRNLSLAVLGDYTNDAANNLHADGDMTVSATGTLTNTGTLAANGALTATGANVVNTATGDINSATTTVNASGTLTNDGRIEGDTVTTNSATLANTGTVIGNDVTVNAADVQNTGAAALIAGANSVHVYAQNSVTNADGALIYSAGNLEIAKDGTRDASGMLANQTGTLTNSAATIEADGDIDIAAHTVSNVRTGVQTQAGTPQDAGSTTLTLWTAGLPPGDMGSYYSLDHPEWRWSDGGLGYGVIGHLMHPITVQVPTSEITNLDPKAQSFSLTTPLTDTYTSGALIGGGDPSTRTITNNPVQYYQSLTDNGNGTYSITFWPDYDPGKNIRPDQVDTRSDLNGTHDYVELSRTASTTTTTDQLLSAGNAATIQAQGAIRINADNGSINNESSTMAAGGDLVRRANGGSVTDTGTVLQQTVMQDTASVYYWHQKTGGSNDTTQPREDGQYDGISQTTTTVDALPAIATSNQNVQTSAQTISINSVNRQGQTVNGSGVTGGSADGTQAGTISGQSGGTAVSGNQIGSVSGQSSNPQTVGGATGGIPNLKLPVNGLYTYNTAPGATYLVVTDPRFTQYTKFISSDYMLGQLGLDPSKIEKRLGDGLYEETLIRNQVTQLTGRTFLAGYSDNLDEYTALMNSGVAYAKEFGLEPGIALTASQMQQLTTDMVWLVSQDVTLPDGSHQTVLVPQVYLAQSGTVDLTHSGALVAGNAVNLNASGDVNNSGHVSSNLATTIIGNNVVNSGIIGSAGTTVVAAVQDVRNVSGRIGGGDVVVQAGRDVINETQTYGVSKTFTDRASTGSVSTTGVDAVGTISATGSATIIAGRDVNLNGALVQAGGNAAITAGRDLNVGTTTLTATKDSGEHDGQNFLHDSVTQNLGSAVVAGGSLATVSGRDTTLTDATLRAGSDATLIAGGNLTVTAARDTHSHSEQSLNDSTSQYTKSSYDETVKGSDVGAGGNVSLAAGQNGSGNLAVLGSSVAADAGGVRMISTGDVTIGSVSETHDAQSWSHDEHSGFLSKEKTTDTTSSHQVIANGSTVSGDTVTGAAGHDMTISGSTVAATHDVSLAAANNLSINTTQDTSESSHFHQDVKTGLGSSGGIGVSYGTVDTKDTAHDRSVTNNGSLVGSTDGSVNLSAGADLRVTGSALIAGQNVTGTGANVTIDSAIDTMHHDETHEVSKSGFTLAVKSSVIDAITNVIDQTHAASHSQDDRAAALHGMAAASSAVDALGAGGEAMGALANGQKPDAKIELSYGSSHSKDTFAEDSTTNKGATVTAGGTAAFVATGDGTPRSGNVTIAGSNVNANDVILAAKNQVNLLNTTDTDSTRSTNQSSSASVGVSYGTQGWGVDAAMSKAHGDANSDAAMQNNTHVSAANTATIISGGDTNIIGANVNGRQVNADVGGNLNIASVQDTMSSSAHQESTGGGFSISQGGGSASFSHTNANASGSYAGVNEQAGIQAGDGGFNISVKGNTDLKGAVIASDADASKNTLSTGTLTYSDIQNSSSYSAHTGGISGGVTAGDGGSNYTTHGNTSGKNTGGGAPMLSQNDSGSDSATTRSGISAGTVSVTDAAHQTQDIASLNRDTSNTNGTVAKLPDVNNLLDRQADMMAAASAAGEAVSRRIGDFANSKFKAARDNGDQVGMDAWKEGGTARAEMQAAGAALVTGLAGGNAIGGAAGAGIASIAGGRLNELSGAIAGSNPTGNADMNMALGNIVANAIATSAGAAVGGDAGAFEGYNTDRFNRQLNVDGKPEKQRDLVSQACPPGAQCSDAVYQAAIQAQMANGDAATGSLQPNYATVSATSLSGTGSVAVNLYDGSTYLSGGVTQSNPSSVSWKPGVAGTVGWVFGVNGAKGTSNYLNGDATQAYISVPTWLGFNANAAITHGYGGATGIELGIGAPGGLSYGVAPWSHATQVSKPIY